MKLYRAADSDYVPTDSCSFAESIEAAEHYLDNPGYGGSTLWVTEVDADDVLDLTGDDAEELLNDVVDVERYGAIGIDELIPRISEQLCKAGIQWVRVNESYPEDTITWIYVGGPCGNEPELEELEA